MENILTNGGRYPIIWNIEMSIKFCSFLEVRHTERKWGTKNMGFKWDRRERLLEYIRGKGEVSVEELARALDISPSTIRRDLDVLAKEEMVIRTHGGALLEQGFSSLVKHFDERRENRKAQKMRIAEQINREIPDSCSVILDNGTTNYYLAQLMVKRKGLTVVTNSVKIAQLLSSSERNSVYLTGGEYRPRNYDCLGDAAVEYFSEIRFDIAVLNADLITPQSGFFKKCCHSARVSKAMVKAARTVYMAADSSKLDGMGNFLCARAEDVKKLFVDEAMTAEQRQWLQKECYEVEFC